VVAQEGDATVPSGRDPLPPEAGFRHADCAVASRAVGRRGTVDSLERCAGADRVVRFRLSQRPGRCAYIGPGRTLAPALADADAGPFAGAPWPRWLASRTCGYIQSYCAILGTALICKDNLGK